MLMTGKTVLVTGGAQGIGRAICEAFLAEGASVALSDINEASVAATAKELAEKARTGAKVGAYKSDVTNSADAENTVNKVVEDFGQVDVLVNNAGITMDGLLVRMTDDAFQKVLSVNLTGAFFMLRAAAKVMMRARSGAIVNIASVVGVMGNAGQANYSASKAGLIGLTKTAARELASRGIRVNAVAPGFIETAMTGKLSEEQKEKLFANIPLKRMGTSADVASAVLFLASEASGYVTGQVLRVCGGMVM
jgi:3-oxoacyl-[acyl-carrier protein] reductase